MLEARFARGLSGRARKHPWSASWSVGGAHVSRAPPTAPIKRSARLGPEPRPGISGARPVAHRAILTSTATRHRSGHEQPRAADIRNHAHRSPTSRCGPRWVVPGQCLTSSCTPRCAFALRPKRRRNQQPRRLPLARGREAPVSWVPRVASLRRDLGRVLRQVKSGSDRGCADDVSRTGGGNGSPGTECRGWAAR